MVEAPTIVVTVSFTQVFDAQLLMKSIVWSNFEIGDLDLWRGEAYTKFFDFLDKKGGFYYEVSWQCST